MKEKIDKFLMTHMELKKHCYELCNKWSEYRKSLEPVVRDIDCGVYDYKDVNINKLEFTYDDDNFRIGYEYYSRCGDTDYFYTNFEPEDLINENRIKERIDAVHQRKIKTIEEDIELKRQQDENKEKTAYQEYLILREKYKYIEENK